MHSAKGIRGASATKRLGTIRLTDLVNDLNREPTAPHEPNPADEQKMKLFEGFARPGPVATHRTTAITPATTLTLRVTEARVEDVGHAIARLAPADLVRLGARPGDVLKITGGTVGVGRVEVSHEGHEGTIQIDGTCRSNCRASSQISSRSPSVL